MPVIPLVVEGLHHPRPGVEWQDLALLLDIVQALGGQPVVVTSPLPGAFFDYWGVTPDQRMQYYNGLRAITTQRGVPLVAFAEHDGDRDFDQDPEGHLTDKGWVQFDEVFDTWYHGRPPNP
jgi:poly-D-alanine transfer protein DltD